MANSSMTVPVRLLRYARRKFVMLRLFQQDNITMPTLVQACNRRDTESRFGASTCWRVTAFATLSIVLVERQLTMRM